MRARSAWDREGSADAYERGRPEHRPEAVAWAAERTGLPPGGRALDLAAGTGRLARALLPLVEDVVAVEPAADMRAEIARRYPEVETLDGTAEAMPLEDASVDAVFVADAFHWFDGARALKEIDRVLADPGGVAVLWNFPAMGEVMQPSVEALNEALSEYRERVSYSHAGMLGWHDQFERVDWLEPLEQRSFVVEGAWKAADVRAFTISWSAVAQLEGEERRLALAEIDRVLADAPAEVPVSFRTEVFAGRRR